MKRILWLIPGLALTSSLLAQQLTNPPPVASIESAPIATNAAAVAPTNPPPVVEAPTQSPAPAPKKAAPVKKAVKTPARKAPQVSTLNTKPLVPGVATVVASNVNVRGQAKLRSEVVTRVTKGQEITVLEEIVRNDSADDEPSAWAKIVLPVGTTVWVHTHYVTNNVVAANLLNVRSGPGENYSVLGQIPRGTTVAPVSTKGLWMEIPAPADAYAFMAAQYLTQEKPTEIVAAPAQTETKAPPAETPVTPVPEPATTETVADAPVVAPAPSDVPTPERPVEVAQAPTTNTVSAATEAGEAGDIPEEPIDEPPPKRVVQREGIVRGTGSIQAPTHFALVSPVNGRLINYLYTSSPSLDLRRYKGLRIIVIGEEALEERWGNTPVITIQKLEVLDE